jgi:hypothetical protein
MKIAILWDMTSLLKVGLFATCLHSGFLLGLFLDPEDGGDMFFLNIG